MSDYMGSTGIETKKKGASGAGIWKQPQTCHHVRLSKHPEVESPGAKQRMALDALLALVASRKIVFMQLFSAS